MIMETGSNSIPSPSYLAELSVFLNSLKMQVRI